MPTYNPLLANNSTSNFLQPIFPTGSSEDGVSVIAVNTLDFSPPGYNGNDQSLISNAIISSQFNPLSSVIEFFVYDPFGNVQFTNDNFTNYKVVDDGQVASSGLISNFEIDPIANLQGLGLDEGEYTTYYNYINNRVGTANTTLYISEIDRELTNNDWSSKALITS